MNTYTGTVIRAGSNGFGFVEVHGTRTSLFFHVKQAIPKGFIFREGDPVKFEIGTNEKGDIAVNVRLVQPINPQEVVHSGAPEVGPRHEE